MTCSKVFNDPIYENDQKDEQIIMVPEIRGKLTVNVKTAPRFKGPPEVDVSMTCKSALGHERCKVLWYLSRPTQ